MSRPDDQCIRCGQRGHQSSSCPMPYATGQDSLSIEAREQRALYPSPEQRYALATKLQAEHPDWQWSRCDLRALIEWQKGTG